MFLILAVVLVVLWLGGFVVLHVASLLIHLLLLFAVISIVMHFVSWQRRTVLEPFRCIADERKVKGRARQARPFT